MVKDSFSTQCPLRYVVVVLCAAWTTIRIVPTEAWSLSNKTLYTETRDHVTIDSTFRRWCDAVGIRANKLVHGRDTVDGIPGVTVRANTMVMTGEVVIVVPIDAAIVVLADVVDDDDKNYSTKISSPIPEYLSDEAWERAPPKLRLACKLLREYHLGEESYHVGYVDHLPPVTGPGRERCDTLDRWTDDELDRLHSPSLVAKIKERVTMDNQWFASLRIGSCSRIEFDWAIDVVRTRAFSGDYSIPHNAQANDIALLPFIDDLNHRETIDVGSSPSLLPSDRTTIRRATATASFAFPSVTQVLGRTRDAVCWVAHQQHQSGVEVAHSYLDGPDGLGEDFLYEWGFVPHELDANAVRVHGVCIVLRRDGSIHSPNDNNINNNLKAIRRALAQHRRQQREDSVVVDSTLVSDADVYRSIASHCEMELDALPSAEPNDTSDGDVNRMTMARAYISGKKLILLAGRKWAQEQATAYESRSNSLRLS